MLPGWPSNGGIGQPALAGAILHGDQAPTSREHCRGGPATAVPSSRTWQATSGVTAPRRWQGGAPKAAWLWQHSLAGTVRHHLEGWPGVRGKGVLLGQPSYGSTVWQDMAGTVQHGSLAPTARGRCWGGPAMAARSRRHWQAPSGTAAWRLWLCCAAGAARLRRHRPACPSRSCPAQRLGARGNGVLLGWPSYGSTVWLDPEVSSDVAAPHQQ